MRPLKSDPVLIEKSKDNSDDRRRLVKALLGVTLLAQVLIERRSTHINVVQQIARFDVVVDDRSGKGEGATSALGRMRVHDALDKCMEPVDWVGVVVVAFIVADLNIHNLEGISGIVVLEGGKQRSDLANEFLLGDACSFCLCLLFDLVQGLALLTTSCTLSIV